MNTQEKLALLEETFDLEEGDVKEEMVLDEQEWWDSLGKLSLIVMIEDNFGYRLSSSEVKALATVKDILNAMEGKGA